MISMSKVHDIRKLKREGESVASIARIVGVSRDTVYKYVAADDLSPEMPVQKRRASKLDAYRPLIEQWLDEDAENWRKQRHTAHKVWERLTTEEGVKVSEARVRTYVRMIREERQAALAEQFLDLDWAPGTAQADFGEADFYVGGVRTRLSFFVLSFPFSNVGIAQVFPGENAECVCQALKNIFEYLGCVPTTIVFDNAAGVGRRVCEEVRTTDLFGAFASHYGFAFRFCNPRSGNEKGNVERKVSYIRSNVFVPIPRITSLEAYNAKLPAKCMALSAKGHWRKGEPEEQLFVEDRFAMTGLPPKPFNVVRWEKPKTNKQGKFSVDGPHFYSSDPALSERELIVGLTATTVEVYDGSGAFVCSHARAYGSAPTNSSDPASQLAVLAVKAGGWHESLVRSSLPDDLREYMDSLDKPELRASIRLMRDQNAVSGWDAMVEAVSAAYAATGRVDEASVAVAAARIGSGSVDYGEPVDLSEYDRALGIREVV